MSKVTKPSDAPFIYELPDGTKIELPSLSLIDPDVGATEDFLSAAETGNQLIIAAAHLRLLIAGFPDHDLSGLRKVRTSQLQELMAAWQKHSGVTVGESSAS